MSRGPWNKSGIRSKFIKLYATLSYAHEIVSRKLGMAHNRVNWDPNTPIQDQLKGQGQLRDLRNNPNLDGVDINDLLRKTPNELNDMLKNGKINKKTYKQLKKAFEGRDLGKRGKK